MACKYLSKARLKDSAINTESESSYLSLYHASELQTRSFSFFLQASNSPSTLLPQNLPPKQSPYLLPKPLLHLNFLHFRHRQNLLHRRRHRSDQPRRVGLRVLPGPVRPLGLHRTNEAPVTYGHWRFVVCAGSAGVSRRCAGSRVDGTPRLPGWTHRAHQHPPEQHGAKRVPCR